MSKIDAENGLTVISKSLLKLAIEDLRLSVDEEKVMLDKCVFPNFFTNEINF